MNPKHQKFWVIGIAALTILSSTFAALWTQGIFTRSQPERGNYQNVTFTDAALKCESATRAQFKNLLQNLTMDDLSSRLDLTKNTYKIFFNADVARSPTNAETAAVFISCAVNAHTGSIADYEALEKKEPKSESIQKNKGGVFGWPLD